MIETRNEAEWNTYGKIIWTEYVQQIIHKYVGSIIKYDEYDRSAEKHANVPNVYPKSSENVTSFLVQHSSVNSCLSLKTRSAYKSSFTVRQRTSTFVLNK